MHQLQIVQNGLQYRAANLVSCSATNDQELIN